MAALAPPKYIFNLQRRTNNQNPRNILFNRNPPPPPSTPCPQNMLGPGVCGWMCDFGESLPLDADTPPHSNQTAAQLHSLYPSLWGQLNADAISHAQKRAGLQGPTSTCKEDDVVHFMRSGNQFSPAHSRLFWLGDQMVTWDSHDGLATVVTGLLSQGISGYSLSHSDIGGYTALLKFPLKYVDTVKPLIKDRHSETGHISISLNYSSSHSSM